MCVYNADGNPIAVRQTQSDSELLYCVLGNDFFFQKKSCEPDNGAIIIIIIVTVKSESALHAVKNVRVSHIVSYTAVDPPAADLPKSGGPGIYRTQGANDGAGV